MAEGKTIREVLEKELEKRRFVTGQELTVDDLFEPEKLREWTEDLLGNDKMPELRKRIEAVEPERLACGCDLSVGDCGKRRAEFEIWFTSAYFF